MRSVNFVFVFQVALYESIRPLFANKPVLIGLNKVDIIKRGDLKPEKMELLKGLEENSSSIFELSTVTQEGVMDFRNTVSFFFSIM